MKIEEITFRAIASELEDLNLINILRENNIFTREDLEMEPLPNCSACEICENKSYNITRLSYHYKYDEDKEILIECDSDDEDVIDDFIIYVCDNCKDVSYYIEL